MRYLALAFVCLALSTGIAYADGFAQALDKTVGDYIVNVDYDSFTPEIYPQNPTSFSFQLWNKDRTETVPFADVSVNVFQQNSRSAIFSGTLSGGFGQAGMKYVFENGGSYTMQVRFHNENYETLADATFPLTVTHNRDGYGMGALWLILAGLVGFGLAGGAMMYVRRRNS